MLNCLKYYILGALLALALISFVVQPDEFDANQTGDGQLSGDEIGNLAAIAAAYQPSAMESAFANSRFAQLLLIGDE